jgi:phospholipase/carboxylesterase
MNTPFDYIYKAPKVQGEGQPAIFLLHGLGSNENDLLQLVAAFEDNCHIFSLRGPIEHRPGYAFYTFPAEEGKPDRGVFETVLKGTQQFILEALQTYDIALDQAYVIGFNQGAVMAQTIMLTMGNTIRGTVALSGYLPDFVELEYKKADMTGSKIFIAHGEYDYMYPVSWGQASAAYFENVDADVTYLEFAEGHGVTPEVLEALTQFLLTTMPTDKY